jgi:hypothetical protein
MAKKDHRIFVQRRDDGSYAVRRPGSQPASDVKPTQAQAIDRARDRNDGKAPLIERVRHTEGGNPDKWRKP